LDPTNACSLFIWSLFSAAARSPAIDLYCVYFLGALPSPPVLAGAPPLLAPSFSWLPTMPPIAVPPSAGPLPDLVLVSLPDCGVTAGAACPAAGVLSVGLGGAEGELRSHADKAMSASVTQEKVSGRFMAIPNIECIKFDPVWVGCIQYNSQNFAIQRYWGFSEYAIYNQLFLRRAKKAVISK